MGVVRDRATTNPDHTTKQAIPSKWDTKDKVMQVILSKDYIAHDEAQEDLWDQIIKAADDAAEGIDDHRIEWAEIYRAQPIA